MTLRQIILLLVYLMTAATASAHPHSFVECDFAFVMDKEGLVGLKQQWILDEMTTATVLDVVDTNHDQSLSHKEKKALRDLTVKSLLDYHYFTAVKINGKDFPVKKIEDFSGELKENKLIYRFLVPCRVKAVNGVSQKVTAAVYDSSFYSFVAYAKEGGIGIDPTKDPLFADPDAPARPDDFKRFAKAVGVGKYKGKVQIQGNTADFDISTTVREEPAMAYFYDRIVPQAFVLSFSLK